MPTKHIPNKSFSLLLWCYLKIFQKEIYFSLEKGTMIEESTVDLKTVLGGIAAVHFPGDILFILWNELQYFYSFTVFIVTAWSIMGIFPE